MSWRRPPPESLSVGAVLTVLIGLGQISTSVYIPSMPSLVEALATTPERVNLTLSVFLAGFAASQLVYGPLSDLYGRRRVLLAGLGLYFVASLACVAANSIEALIAARFVQALGACAGPALGRAIVRDVYGRDRAAKALAYIGIAFAVSPAVTPIIGGYLQVWFGWRANFVFLAGVAAAVLGAVWLLLAETSPQAVPLKPRDMVRTCARLLADRLYLGFALSVSLVFAGLMAYAALSPFVFIGLFGLTPDGFGMLSIFNVVGFVCGTVAAGRLTTRLGPARMVLMGILLAVAGSIGMCVPALAGVFTVAAVIAPMTLFMAGVGMVFPNAIAGVMAPFPRAAGAASAMVGFLQMAISGMVAGLAGRLVLTSQLPLALVLASSALAALVAYLGLVWRRQNK